MVMHYVYREPDKASLNQGDVLDRTPALVALLEQYHQHYAHHPSYRYFVVLTQSCDLVRRGGPPKSPYIAVAAARPIGELILREAAKYQEEWQRETKVVGSKAKERLIMFIQHLLDNNEPQYFYLHNDISLGIHEACCVHLALSVALRAEHYDTILAAKIAQLTDTFQAKLGWLIGNMYSRVGTTEWDHEYTDNPCKAHAEQLLNKTLVPIAEDQIKEGIAALRERKELEGKTPQEILDFIQRTTVLSRKEKFEARAADVIRDTKRVKIIKSIRGRASYAIREGGVLKKGIVELLQASGVEQANDLADKLIRLFDDRMTSVMSDETMPGREELLTGLLRSILQDTKVAATLR